MRRRLFNFAAAVSLVLCAVTVVCWIVSNHRIIAFEFVGRDGAIWEVAARNGRLLLDTYPQYWLDAGPYRYYRLRSHWLSTDSMRNGLAYQQMLKLQENGEITPSAWEKFQQESATERRDIAARMAVLASKRQPAPPAPPVMHSLACSVLVVCCTMLPATWTVLWFLSRRTQANRHRLNLCAACGYNLTGNTSGVCPECGKPIADLRGGGVTMEKSPAK